MNEPSPPNALLQAQQWFGSCLLRPLIDRRCAAASTLHKASHWLSSSPNLTAENCLEIYNQQYWWRLLSLLQAAYPFLLRLFATEEFNKSIAEPYLFAHPPSHWSLKRLGMHLPSFLKRAYHQCDKEFVVNAALLDLAHDCAFYFAQTESIARLNPQVMLQQTLYLQPCVFLLRFPYDLAALRRQFLIESVDYWLKNPFPPMKRDRAHFYIIYRTKDLTIAEEEISQWQWYFLHDLQKGLSIHAVCNLIEKEKGERLAQTFSHLSSWIEGWITKELLTLSNSFDFMQEMTYNIE